jgi:hypothetical protein
MRKTILPILMLLSTVASAHDRIARIEFFGIAGVDVKAVREALPFKQGDPLPQDIKSQANAAVLRVTGKEATDVAMICCVGDSDTTVYIGLPGMSSRAYRVDAAPQGDTKVSAELARLSEEMETKMVDAVRAGHGDQDGAPGYRLPREPASRGATLAVRDYALHHEAELLNLVATSGDAHQRAIAVDTLGFGTRTSVQMATLLWATRDPDEGVRNNATRALMEILRGDPGAAAQLPADNFIDMLRSGMALDRNKGSFLLMFLTASRDPAVLARIQSEASDALAEMANWQTDWALPARIIQGRIAGRSDTMLFLSSVPLWVRLGAAAALAAMVALAIFVVRRLIRECWR